ncbi:MAG: hypothetical protein DSM106950_35225 [Stigonema ocellatum SAG 48.90 = DSM 106950]|nr:hypothetical protein [Stigonema ocellatum SAG 48.90 = DSM 106950]
MSRLCPVFEAPGSEEEELPLPPSPWHFGRQARLPKEHWERIIELAGKQHSHWEELLEQASYLDGDFSALTPDKTSVLRVVLNKLCQAIANAEPLVPEATVEIPEPLPNSEHVRMVEAVIAVIDESLKSSGIFDSYVD